MSSSPRFLIIRGGAIGDFILTVPVIAAVRERWRNAHIEVLSYPHIAQLAVAPELLNGVREISDRGVATFFAHRGELDRDFRSYFGQFQQIVSFLYDPDQVFETNVKTVSRRYLAGIHKPTEPQPPVQAIHASSQLIKVLESLAIYVENPVARLYPQRAERMFAHDFYRGTPPRPLIAVHPGSGGESKVWPVANWLELCRWVIAEQKGHVLLIGGEADQANVELLRSRLPAEKIQLANKLKLPQLGAVLEQATLFIGHDSGISHLAAAVATPSLVLFGPTNPAVWRPLGPGVRILHGAGEWRPEPAAPFWQKPMDAIPVASVKGVVEELLTKK